MLANLLTSGAQENPALWRRALALLRPDADPRARLVAAGLCGLCGIAGWLLELGGYLPAAYTLLALAYLLGAARATYFGATALLERRLEINFLMVIVALAALFMGHWGDGLVLLFLFSLSDALESYAVQRTRRSISALLELRPDTARVVQQERTFEVRLDELRVGDVIRALPGERFPIDGEIISGAGAIDEAVVTGESIPIDKRAGDSVFAGTINLTGSLLVRMTRPAAESTLARIVHLVEVAQEQKARAQRLIERWQGPYVLGVLIMAVIVFLGVLVQARDAQAALYRAMLMLVAASPCAVVLASPVAVLATVTRGARHGVLFKGGSHIERLAGVTALAFDKTGTLTLGKPAVSALEPLPGTTADDLLALAATLESHSQHPLARAIVAHAAGRDLALAELETFQSDTGLGVCGQLKGTWIGVGRAELFERHGRALPAELLQRADRADGRTRVLVYSADGRGGSIALADQVRPEASDALHQLRELGLERMVLLTGDQAEPARHVAQQLGIREVYARLRPEDKLAQIHKLAKATEGIAMIGDGVNDAPALAAATVGIAMGGAGSDVALENADVVLLRDNLHGLAEAVHLARHCRETIRRSLMIAFGAIGLLVVLTLSGLMILPVAVLGHEGSTVLVVLNGLLLLRQDNVLQHLSARDRRGL